MKSLSWWKICIILTRNLNDILLQDYLTVMRIMLLSVLIIEKYDSNCKRPSTLIIEDKMSFSTTGMPTSNFCVLFSTMSWVTPTLNLNSCQMATKFIPKSKQEKKETWQELPCKITRRTEVQWHRSAGAEECCKRCCCIESNLAMSLWCWTTKYSGHSMFMDP